MIGMTSVELAMMLILMSSGNDVLSLIDPADFFKSRNVPVTLEKMVELATTPAANPKAEISQLLALRYLAEDAAVKKAPNLAEILKKVEEVAEGKKGPDTAGFAAEYARRTAVALGSKLAPPKAGAPDDSVRQDAMNWFPKTAGFVAGIDLRQGGRGLTKDAAEMRQKLVKFMPAMAKDELYRMVEETGNLRLDRASLAYQEDPQNGKEGKLYIRLTGKGNHKGLVAYLRKMMPPAWQFKEMKSFRGQPIGLFWRQNVRTSRPWPSSATRTSSWPGRSTTSATPTRLTRSRCWKRCWTCSVASRRACSTGRSVPS